MTRRPVRRGSKSLGVPGGLVPRPMAPMLSAARSPCCTAPAGDTSAVAVDDAVNALSIASLTLDTPLIPLRRKSRVPASPFPFLQLPSELRVKVYEHYFRDTEKVLDLSPENYKRIHKTLGFMRVCRQIHEEATYFFYSTRSVRIFPTYPGKYFKSKKPMLARLKPKQRQCITSLELRLGPGWNAPPRGWVVNDALGLKDCINVKKLVVYVECDPSDGFFKGFRRSDGFYEQFSARLLSSVLDSLPATAAIEFEAWSSVKKTGAMMQGLLGVAVGSRRTITWGPERGWTDGPETQEDAAGADDAGEAAQLIDGVSLHDYTPHNVMVVA
ncbi:hypothetical protein E4U43_008659 [Claviceps pusilla]|uniref:F-box domain-containing protein n=1 Tax=Claviceps pusilla TaxID=123648 RepID=A0A9P7NAI7_9HYPO|nr:hypothetical protein E4U43_008659 [Claviceps pusilla]